jgi:hypothetical protein
MFKKIATIVMALCFVSTLAFAGASISTIDIGAAGGSDDTAVKISNHGWGNDGAFATGGSGGEATNYGQAGMIAFGKAPTEVEGKVCVYGETEAAAYAKDFGTTSIAGAAVGTEVKAKASGEAEFGKGFGLGYAVNKSTAEISGEIKQCNYAQEIGYASGTFAQAQNESGAFFSAKAYDCDGTVGFGKGEADSRVKLSGEAFTAGGSIASVDASGHHQSAFAATGNLTYVDVRGADCEKTRVYGNGEVAVGANAISNSGAASAGGNASFGYVGNSFGAGGAVMSATANAGHNSFSATATGSAFAVGK